MHYFPIYPRPQEKEKKKAALLRSCGSAAEIAHKAAANRQVADESVTA
jgi:hypothetical protein